MIQVSLVILLCGIASIFQTYYVELLCRAHILILYILILVCLKAWLLGTLWFVYYTHIGGKILNHHVVKYYIYADVI